MIKLLWDGCAKVGHKISFKHDLPIWIGDYMIKVDKLDKYFNKNKKNEIHVINNTSLTFDNTGLVCILGESGSGKTTLLNTMSGLDTFSGGSITVDELRINEYSSVEMDRLRNRKFGYIFQNYYLLSDYTVEYNIKLALKCLNMDEVAIDERVNYVLDAVDMRKYKKRIVTELSGGQRQRVAIARALAKTPDIIFADEPTGNLDENNTLRVMSILKKASKSCLVILVTHEKRIAEFFADRIIKVKDGAVVEDKINCKSGSYSNGDDRGIYLRELEKKEIRVDDSCINVYSDGTEFSISLNLVFSDGKLYIGSDIGTNIEYIDEESETRLVDDVKPKLNMEEFDNTVFEIEKVPVEVSNRLSLRELISMACYNIKNVGKKQLFMYIVFVISSVLMLLSMSDYYKVISAKTHEKVSADSHCVTVECKDARVAELAYEQFVTKSGIEGQIYGNKKIWISITSHNYAQLKSVNQVIKGYSYVDIDNLSKEDLLYGRMPENEYEIVVDKAVLEGVLEGENILAAISEDVTEFLNVKCSYNSDEFLICGISDNEEMSVYMATEWLEWGGEGDEARYLKKNFVIYSNEPWKVEKFFDRYNKEFIAEYYPENEHREPVVNASYIYGEEMEVYRQKVEDDIHVRNIITGVVFLLSVVVLVFTMKANSIRRTEEIVVYRLIGITPGNIIFSYVVEIFIITLYTQVIPMIISTMVCGFLSDVNAFEMFEICPWYYVMILIIAIFIVNIIVSVLSVLGLIMRPPAQLAAKN